MTAIILYSDPNCPFCYALGERLEGLGLDGQIEWRGVQHAPRLPIPRVVQAARMQAMIDQEVRAVQRLAPEVPIQAVTGKPNTGPAIRVVAVALPIDHQRAHQLRVDLYRALWQRNEDISSPDVLTTLTQALGLPDLLVELSRTSASAARAAEWERAWEDIGIGSVPLLVRADGEYLSGLVGAEMPKGFVSGGLVGKERP